MIRRLAYTAALMSIFSITVQAEEAPTTVNEWMDQASSAITKKVEYPDRGAFYGQIDTNTFEVTVNRQGDILDYKGTVKAKRKYFDKASRRALGKVNLPSLPSSYEADTLSFSIVLDYIDTEKDLARLHGENYVQHKQITLLPPEGFTSTETAIGGGF